MSGPATWISFNPPCFLIVLGVFGLGSSPVDLSVRLPGRSCASLTLEKQALSYRELASGRLSGGPNVVGMHVLAALCVGRGGPHHRLLHICPAFTVVAISLLLMV